MKVCFKCQVEKPIDDFYKHPRMADGHLGKCKECTKKDVRENYRKNIHHYLDYDRGRSKSHDRIAARAPYQLNYRLRNPEKYIAHYEVHNAIRDGRLTRQRCEVCGKKAEAHHEDYSKPLEVRWLCFKHHRQLAHGQMQYLSA